MSAERNSWQASIYADTRLIGRDIAARLAQILGGSVSGDRGDIVVAGGIDVDVTQNDERPPSEPVDPDDAFLYYPYDIEIFTEEAFDEKALVGDVSALLAELDRLGVRYVTVADFEDDLPGGGRSST